MVHSASSSSIKFTYYVEVGMAVTLTKRIQQFYQDKIGLIESVYILDCAFE